MSVEPINDCAPRLLQYVLCRHGCWVEVLGVAAGLYEVGSLWIYSPTTCRSEEGGQARNLGCPRWSKLGSPRPAPIDSLQRKLRAVRSCSRPMASVAARQGGEAGGKTRAKVVVINNTAGSADDRLHAKTGDISADCRGKQETPASTHLLPLDLPPSALLAVYSHCYCESSE